MRLYRVAGVIGLLAIVPGAWLNAAEAEPPPGFYAVIKPSDNPLAKPGAPVPVPTIAWEKVAVRPDHPRMLFNREMKKELIARVNQLRQRPALLADVEKGDPLANALMYQVTGREDYARAAIRELVAGRIPPGNIYQMAAYVYDWVFDAMTESERREATAQLWAMATVDRGTGWPRCSPYTGYPEDPRPSETRPDQWLRFYNWTFHDQDWARRDAPTLEAIVALAHHAPRAEEGVRNYWEYSLKDAALFLDHIRDGSYWQGNYWAITTRISEIYRVFALMKTACGIDYLDPKTHPYLANVGRWLLYCTDVPRKRFIYNYGDGEMVTDASRIYIPAIVSGNLSKDPRTEWLAQQLSPEGADWFSELFYHDPNVPSIGPGDLPPARAFPGTGLAVLRSDWGGTGVWASVRWADWFDMHCHPDVGSFILYCVSPLAPDTGFYTTGNYHATGYYNRTVAHNTITIRDPKAKVVRSQENPYAINDGCQRGRDKRTWSFAVGTDAWVYHQDYFKRGNLLAFESQDLYSYTAGEGANAYPGGLAKEFIRQAVLLNSGVFIVFDRVETARAELEKRWLMHLVGEPKVDGRLVRAEVKGHIEDYDGSLSVSKGKSLSVVRCHTLLPAARIIRKVGGAMPNIPTTTLCRVPRTSQRMGTGSRWEWTDPLIFYYDDPLTGKRLGAFCIERNIPTDAEFEVTDSEFYLKLHAFDRAKTEELRLRLASYPTLLDLAIELGSRLEFYTAFHYLPGYEYYNEGVNYAPAYKPYVWHRPKVEAPELYGGPNDAGSWRIEVLPTKPATRDYFLNVMRVQAAEGDEPGQVSLVRDTPELAEAQVILAGKTYLVSFNKTGEVGGHLRITDAAGKVLSDRALARRIEQKD